MAVTRTILHCSCDPEPQSFHDADGMQTLAINLGFEIQTDVTAQDIRGDDALQKQALLESDERVAKTALGEFLSVIPDVSFHIYTAAADGVLTHLGSLEKTSEDIDTDSAAAAMAWLETAEKQIQRPRHFWTTPAMEDAAQAVIEALSAPATFRLRAAQSWNAPVGHKLGLTHLVRAAGLADGASYVVVPTFGAEAPAQNLTGTQFGERWDISCDVGGGLGTLICRTTLLRMPDAFIVQPDAVSEFLTADGYIVADDHTETIWRIQQWFEAQAASLMMTTDVLIRPQLGDRAEGDLYFTLFPWPAEAASFPGVENAWRAITALTAMLDNIVIGMMQPLSGSAAVGDILAPLVVDLADRFERDIVAPFSLTPDLYDSNALVKALRLVLSQHHPLFRKTLDVGNEADVAQFKTMLTVVHGLPAFRDATTDEIRLLRHLVDSFPQASPAEANIEAFRTSVSGREETLLQRALAEAEKRLQDEAGAETVILQILAFPGLDSLFANAYSANGHPQETDLREAVRAAFAAALQDYRTLLDTAFNGAEAIRRAASSEFTKALLAYPKTVPDPGKSEPDLLIAALRGADYYSWRLLGLDSQPHPDGLAPSSACFAIISGALTRPPAPLSVQPLQVLLSTAYRAAVDPVMRVENAQARFVPDLAPAPLPHRIAANIGGSELDAFARDFNGIALAIRRLDGPAADSRWAHASLASLAWGSGRIDAAIHPTLPAINDGRGAMFIEYHGMPLATPIAAASDTAIAPVAAPFYVVEPPVVSKETFAPIPRLAYGRNFETFGFASTNAGSLPRDLQGTKPWLPAERFAPPATVHVISKAYQRRTTIGHMALQEVVASGQQQRVGGAIKNVHPLANDYPRAVINAFAGSPGSRDLCRTRDGASGTLSIRATDTTPRLWRLDDVVTRGKPSFIRLSLFSTSSVGPDDDGVSVSISFDAEMPSDAPANISFGVDVRDDATGMHHRDFFIDCDGKIDTRQLPDDLDITEGWVRLSLGTDDRCTLSFATGEDLNAYEPAAPLLLLAPSEPVWQRDRSAPVTLTIDAPRVVYADFERWFANPDLRDAVFGSEKVWRTLENALLVAYALRGIDRELGAMLDRLPDPAVSFLRLELGVQDRLVEGNSADIAAFADIRLDGRLGDIATKLDGGTQWTPKLLKSLLFRPIEEQFRFDVTIAAGDFDLSEAPCKAFVPPGCVARLSVDALVSEDHFADSPRGYPPVMHPGLAQHAARKLSVSGLKSSYLAYPSVALCVETMIDGMKPLQEKRTADIDSGGLALADAMIHAVPVAGSRGYEIRTRSEATPEQCRSWRLLGEVDTSTQRWRAGGRPIYHAIRPRDHADDVAIAASGHAALPLVRTKGDQQTLQRFEEEAFFDRSPVDYQTKTQRLLPFPASTALEMQCWESPSATYFRHRFTLRSRYAGALVEPARRVAEAWSAKDMEQNPSAAWTMRVAMLADLSHVILTRPQQRALIPLTAAPRSEGARSGTPPILAVLQEPPFSRAGLADRIAAEIKTGLGYGFNDEGGQVRIIDARKEIGLDPRLSYTAFDERRSLGMALAVEGPIGLTFDAMNAAAPAFPNTMLSLAPVALVGEQQTLEDHFLGLSMCRYIDPEWAVAPPPSDADRLDIDACWWIRHEKPSAVVQPLISTTSPAPRSVLEVRKDDDDFVVLADRSALDPASGAAPLAVGRFSQKAVTGFALLHQPLAPGRYVARLFVYAAAHRPGISDGSGSGPLVLCSLEWNAPQGNDQDTSSSIILSPGIEARRTMASAPTFLAWSRIGRNFDTVHSPDAPADTRSVPVESLLATLNEEKSILTFAHDGFGDRAWLTSSTFGSPVPLHVQRHLAVITTRYREEPGRLTEDFCRAALACGRDIALPAGRSGEARVRLVEFETPSAILCGTNDIAPPTYHRAYIDLVSTGFEPSKDGQACGRLFFRFAGGDDHLRAFRRMTVNVRFHEETSALAGEMKPVTHSIDIPFDGAKPDFHAVAVELLMIRRSAEGVLQYRPTILYSDGNVVRGAPIDAPDDRGLRGPKESPGFFVDVATAAAAGAGEFWTDVSFLHGRRAPEGPGADMAFDFDWLFSPPGEDAASSVSPVALNAMVEAQARIVAMTPPIDIRTPH